jgi:hypothetical protein
MGRLPHRLVKPPTQMNRPELFILAVLGTSVTIGLAQMGYDAVKVYRGGRSRAEGDTEGQTQSNTAGAACPMNWGKQN